MDSGGSPLQGLGLPSPVWLSGATSRGERFNWLERNWYEHTGLPATSGRGFFGYTLVVELILKLVAGLLAGLRGYFLIVAGMVAVPSIFFLLVLVIRLIKPSRARPGGEKNS